MLIFQLCLQSIETGRPLLEKKAECFSTTKYIFESLHMQMFINMSVHKA